MMKFIATPCLALIAAFVVNGSRARAEAPALPPPWMDYVRAEDQAFKWQTVSLTKFPQGQLLELKLTSQVWQGATWTHAVTLFVPAVALANDTAVLYLGAMPPQHARTRQVDNLPTSFKELSTSEKVIRASSATGLACAVVTDLPSQSFGRVDPQLSDFAKSQHRKTGDPSWLPIAPNVKAIVRAMDLMTEACRLHGNIRLERFVLVGHSKYGMLAWMCPLADARVAAIVPIGADAVNLPAQLAGRGSFNWLAAQGESPENRTNPHLLDMADPYRFRDRLTIAKLIISGANDELFNLNSVNAYWDGLPHPKASLLLDDADHSHEAGDTRAIRTTFALARAVALRKPLPALEWKYSPSLASPRLEVTPSGMARHALVWSTSVDGDDFHHARWISRRPDIFDTATNRIEAVFEKPLTGRSANYIEVQMELDGEAYWLTTPVYLLQP